MPNTPTTHASVASRLTDEEIAYFAKTMDGIADSHVCTDEESRCLPKEVVNESMESEVRYRSIAAVLRDYVRLRGIVKSIEEAIVGFDDYEYKKIKRLLAESEKGEEK